VESGPVSQPLPTLLVRRLEAVDLAEDERIESAYQAIRDLFVFINKRLTIRKAFRSLLRSWHGAYNSL